MAKAYDSSGNVGASSPLCTSNANRAKDTAPPTVSITQPLNGATVSGTINVTALAWDESGISNIEFYTDDKLMATDSQYPYVYRWNTKSVKNGWHMIMVRAYDSSGNHADASTKVYVYNRK